MNKYLIVLLLLFVFSLQNKVLGSLESQVASKYQSNSSKPCITFSSSFSKSPFGDSMSNVEKSSMKLKVAGVQYVKSELSQRGCSLSDSKIYAILYNFVPEFRAEIARSLKMDSGDYDSENYVFEEETILKYCDEYFKCAEAGSYDDSVNKITSNTDEHVKTNCEEFFQKNYREGQDNQWRIENTHMMELGSDRYWNQTLQDSPYDVMWDLGIEGNSLYQDSNGSMMPVGSNEDILNNMQLYLDDDFSILSSEDDYQSNLNFGSDGIGNLNNLDLGNFGGGYGTSRIDYILDLLDDGLRLLNGGVTLGMSDGGIESVGLKNSLNDLITENSYRGVGLSPWNVIDKFSIAVDDNLVWKYRKKTDLDKVPEPIVTLPDNSDFFRYSVFAMNFGRREFGE